MAKFGYKEEEFPPLAPGRGKGKSMENPMLGGLTRNLKISLAMTGEVITEFPAQIGCKIAVVSEQLRDIRPLPLGLVYKLAVGDRVLDPGSHVRDLEHLSVTELQAHVHTIGSIVLPGVTGAAELPESGDIIVASEGDITSGGGGRREALGPDDGQSSYMWLWRLKKSQGYALEHATLLTRRQSYSTEELHKHWNDCVSTLQAGEKPESMFMAFSKAMIEEFGEEPPEVLPYSKVLKMYTFAHAHSEKYVLLAWNKSSALGSIGLVDRLDTETGDVECVARISDIWKAVSIHGMELYSVQPATMGLQCQSCMVPQSHIQIASRRRTRIWSWPTWDQPSTLIQSSLAGLLLLRAARAMGRSLWQYLQRQTKQRL